MNISEHFDIREFVPPEIYEKFGDNSRWFVNPAIIKLAEFYRTYWNRPVTINNWHTGGQFKNRGLRTPACTEGATYSQHRFMNAFDCNVDGITPKQMYEAITLNEKVFLAQGLTTLEHIDSTPGWLHSDIRWHGMDKILIVKP